MKRRRRLSKSSEEGGSYFASPTSSLQFIHTGATTLDCVCAGGWPLGRIVNIVGDRSAGKTLLAIEAMANFSFKFPEGRIRYREPEAAFLDEYAGALGLPLDKVEFTRKEETKEEASEADTVERWHKDLRKFVDSLDGAPGLYILDSLDALSDDAEVKRKIGESSYGMGKAKHMSEMFRKITKAIEASNVCLIVISQIRDNINAMFGRNYTRAGGKALDFYSTIIIYLAHIGEIRRTVNNVKRTVGVKIKAKCTKNKVGLPFRSCEFPIIFGYGIEDISSGLEWLKTHNMLKRLGMTQKEIKIFKTKALNVRLEKSEVRKFRKLISKLVRQGWKDVELSFLPKTGKYGG